MVIQEITSLDALAEIGPAWGSLLKNVRTNTIFQTYEWVSSWWEVYGKSSRLCVLILKEGEEIRGIAPLMLRDYKVLRRLTLIGRHRADYSDFIVHKDRPEDYRAFLSHLAFGLRNYDEVMLENVPETSPLLHALDEYSPRFIIKKHVIDVCPYLTLDERTEEILRNIERKQSLKRKMKKLSEKGTLRFRHYSDQEEMEKALGPLLEAYLQRFDRANLKKRLPLEIDFHLELLRRMGPKEMIQFSVLELDDQPIAQHFGFSYNGVYHWVKPGFNPLYAEHSPGVVMLYYLIEHAWKNGYREFDFLRGKEPFKTNIAEHFRQVMMVKLYRSFPKSILCEAGTKLSRWLQGGVFRQT
jgi:CelD/BcsL family acetyltransferase involved in cellulose biosynthesis